ncbi:MAG: TVP38/TMEM64 family protein, partial [Aggregatilineales bacterium]
MSEQPVSPDNPGQSQQKLPMRQIALSAAGFMIPLTFLAIFMNTVGLPRLQELTQQSGALGVIAYITVKALAFVIAPLSSGPLQMASGPLFSIELAILYTLIGDVIGGSINFLIARYLGRNLLERFVSEEDLEKMD